MATISGRVIYNRARSTSVATSLPGIGSVPIALQDVASGALLAVLTDAGGNYAFLNVPDGSYRIVERYGFTPAQPTPGDFAGAAAHAAVDGCVRPPASAIPGALLPPGATHLDCIRPGTLLLKVSGADVTGQYFVNGPVKYTPIAAIIDSHAIVSGTNLLDGADLGAFGQLPPGTPAGSCAPANPYPQAGAGFSYVASDLPHDGEFTIMNINNNGGSGGTWWRFADHTAGDETGRMMVINGYSPGAEIFRETVTVRPDTYYLFSAWILNMIKGTGYADPALGVEVLDSGGNVLFDQRLGQLVPANTNSPEWVQAGTVLELDGDATITVLFSSEGPASNGNDYAMDDIGLYEVTMPQLEPVKACSATGIAVGETVTYTVTLTNFFDRAIQIVTFRDPVPDGLAFVPGSVTVDGAALPNADPNAGFSLPDVEPGQTLTIRFMVTASQVPPVNPTVNAAIITYEYTIVEGGIPSPAQTMSNEVPLFIGDYADVSVKKRGAGCAKPGDVLMYTITVVNRGPEASIDVVLKDAVPPGLVKVAVSVDGGATWQPWPGSLALGTMASGESLTVLIRGAVAAGARVLVNTAAVSATTYDPNLLNNTSTVVTKLPGPRDQAMTDIIESIALEQAALAHILNAEGEKIQAMLGMDGVTGEQLMTMNDSVAQLIGAITRLEAILESKLKPCPNSCTS